MIIFRDNNHIIDNRHTVAIINSISFAKAIQINEDSSYESVLYMTDNMMTWSNEAIVDATEEEKEIYRKKCHDFKIGDKVIIRRGRKMLNEIKVIKSMFTYSPEGTYGHCITNYLVFTDGTKVNRLHCDII